jgi:hypothetical protein
MSLPLLAVFPLRTQERGLHLPVLGVAGVPAVASASPRGLCPVASTQIGAGEAAGQNANQASSRANSRAAGVRVPVSAIRN